MAASVKRFWKTAEPIGTADGWGILLDGRALKTPARAAFVIHGQALAVAIAREWNACGAELQPSAMPLTGLANAAIDHVAPDPARFAADLARYGEGDLLCYRAQMPPTLVAAQSAHWDPLLDWARRRFEIDFAIANEVIHVSQPAPTIERLREAIERVDPFRLAALSPIVTIGGSLVGALALVERAFPVDTVWDAVSLDDRWQIERWGADAEAVAALAARHRDFLAAARFLDLLV